MANETSHVTQNRVNESGAQKGAPRDANDYSATDSRDTGRDPFKSVDDCSGPTDGTNLAVTSHFPDTGVWKQT